jgi:hypothetical protein
MTGETITRPNGKPYRRRKPLTVIEFLDPDGGTGILVLGTHDEARAREAFGQTIEALFEQDHRPERSWVRLVPWDQSGTCDSSWVHDESRGTPALEWSW